MNDIKEIIFLTRTKSNILLHVRKYTVKVRSGQVWGTYAGAARRRVRLATVLLRPPSGHRPGRCRAGHVYILQIGLHLTQPRSVKYRDRSTIIKVEVVINTNFHLRQHGWMCSIGRILMDVQQSCLC